jgi:DNA (cytosine-5)-methyltransferase 1
MELVLSLFHSIDLLGRGFEQENFCVVRAAEIELGFDIRDFHLLPHRFDGVIAGTPCQAFSLADYNRKHKGKFDKCDCAGCQMLIEFERVITEGQPKWFVLENVPTVPNVNIPGYKIQRIPLNAAECGSKQNRPRVIQFGSLDGSFISIKREKLAIDLESCVMASKTSGRSFTELCELQGLPSDFEIPFIAKKNQAIGNGVPLPMAQAIAAAVASRISVSELPVFCLCGCGQRVFGRADKKAATTTCRKRLQIKRERTSAPTIHAY